jgi:hypothetical protein
VFGNEAIDHWQRIVSGQTRGYHEEESEIRVVVCAGNEAVEDINKLSDGLAGELYGDEGWMARFSKEKGGHLTLGEPETIVTFWQLPDEEKDFVDFLLVTGPVVAIPDWPDVQARTDSEIGGAIHPGA